MLVTPKFCICFVFSFSWELKWPQEKLKTMLMQNFATTNKEHYGMLWYFLEWSIVFFRLIFQFSPQSHSPLPPTSPPPPPPPPPPRSAPSAPDKRERPFCFAPDHYLDYSTFLAYAKSAGCYNLWPERLCTD